MGEFEHDLGGPSEEPILSIRGPHPRELAIPPVFHAAPAATAGVLSVEQLVTLQVSTGWLVDECIVLAGPYGGGDGEAYEIAALAEYQAAQLRKHEQADVPADKAWLAGRLVPTADLWIYRASQLEQTIEDLEPSSPSAWLDRVLDGGPSAVPPTPRHPRPARELPSLTGRRLYGPDLNERGKISDGWDWWVAITEPINEDDDIFVRLATLANYEAAKGGSEVRWVGMPLRLLYAY